jgi:ATP synthase protein I
MRYDDGDNKGRQDGFSKALSYLSQIGITIIACIAVGILSGGFFDSLLGSAPWLLLVCTLLGVAAAFKSIYDFAAKH